MNPLRSLTRTARLANARTLEIVQRILHQCWMREPDHDQVVAAGIRFLLAKRRRRPDGTPHVPNHIEVLVHDRTYDDDPTSWSGRTVERTLGDRITGEAADRIGHRIRLVRVHLTRSNLDLPGFIVREPNDARPARKPTRTIPRPADHGTVTLDDIVHVIDLCDPVVVGSDPERSDIVIEDDTVSGRHAEIVYEGHGIYRVRDLSSANGTIVSGRRIHQAERVCDTACVLGDAEILIGPPAEPAAPTATRPITHRPADSRPAETAAPGFTKTHRMGADGDGTKRMPDNPLRRTVKIGEASVNDISTARYDDPARSEDENEIIILWETLDAGQFAGADMEKVGLTVQQISDGVHVPDSHILDSLSTLRQRHLRSAR